MTIGNKFHTPPFLSRGDKIGIISTARKITPEEVQPAIDVFQQWGLKVIKGDHLHSSWNQFAGNDQQRLDDLQNMLDDPQIKAVICARGGYGTVRIIDNVDFTAFRNNPKWIVGYSDVTALHSHIHTHFQVETIHATMPLNFPEDGSQNESVKSLKQVLFNGKTEYHLKDFEIFNEDYFRTIESVITGGNLSMLYSLNGTPSDIVTDGKILFIEDQDEYLYHVDRMIVNLKRSGKLENLKALLIGWMSDMNDNHIPFGPDAYQIIRDHTEGMPFPVIFGIPAGHLEPNFALILGRKIRIQHQNVLTLTQ